MIQIMCDSKFYLNCLITFDSWFMINCAFQEHKCLYMPYHRILHDNHSSFSLMSVDVYCNTISDEIQHFLTFNKNNDSFSMTTHNLSLTKTNWKNNKIPFYARLKRVLFWKIPKISYILLFPDFYLIACYIIFDIKEYLKQYIIWFLNNLYFPQFFSWYFQFKTFRSHELENQI